MLRVLVFFALTVGGCATQRPDAAPDRAPGVPAAGSETDPPAPGPSGAPIRVALGATARPDGVPVQFAAVEEDSRCPRGVSCVWEGRARVRLVVGGTPVVLTIPHGGPPREDEPAVATQGGVRVEVLALHPYPGSPEATPGTPVEVELVARTANAE